MTLYLEIVEGDKQGTRTKVQDGLVIGRRAGHLTIEDSKLSNKHAKVEQRADALWLVDLGSSNAIKTETGEKVLELKLTGGVTFTLGRTRLKVLAAEEAPQESTMAVTVTRTFWDNVRELAEKAVLASRGKKLKEATPLNPPLRLSFTRGVQAGSEWFVGYGPRSVGTGSLDLHLEDPSLPAVCFKLVPEESGVRFINATQSEVRLNGKWVQEEALHHGDVIDIVNTQIKISFDAGK